MKKQIVIIGGGFAGITLARDLTNTATFHITLVDKNNYNFFPPLLYQVATGFLEVSSISYPFRKLFHGKKNIHFRLAELQKIVPEENKVILSTGELSYDYLVLATGTESNFFGMENIRKNALPMKTVDDAIELRNALLQTAENATITTDSAERRKLGTIVIAGGGPTGVEIAGMLAEMRMNIMEKDYPELAGNKLRIILADGAPVLLTPMSEQSQKYTYDVLVKMGVEIKLGAQVKDYVDDTVIFAEGESIQSRLLVWTAGVTSRVFDGVPEESYGRGRRLLVDEYNKVQGTQNIYAIGDTCLQATDIKFPQGHPQLAQPAIQQGKNLARNFKAMQNGKPLTVFSYYDKGSMAIIGRNKAVAEIPKPRMKFKGWFAWAMWLFVHLFSLISYRNRIITMYNWTAAYFTKDQSLRMIIRPGVKARFNKSD
ncbi:NAD(P)/FAD-dependent oxidoreductase [Flavihumibacter stibioxidans]|uniref:NADH:ubiquinone reductase (non-electrogenic) n=1 Tax=Flavihumibacter stibioxidans TaxID=1834163 RepID=A0ABR7M8B6_9BACT|nr:NAD(P)/FAD-dependent oxidoreductase [Flavihumibacter stibioxidans]MBC6491285.1 NADH dehydrogenase [Flavihumibacter stibioxidans]